MAPEVSASDMAAFKMYWHRESSHVRSSRMFAGRPRNCQSFSSLLEELWHLLGLTLAPAEWKFPLHQGALLPADPKELRKQQIILTEHIHNVLQALIRRLVTGRRRCTSCLWHREDPTLGYALRIPEERNHSCPRHMDVNRSSLLELKPHDSMLDVCDALSSSMDSTLLLVRLLCLGRFFKLSCFGAVLSLLASCCIC